MTRFTIAAAMAAVFASVGAQVPLESPLGRADLAWERGDYISALEGYLALLDSPQADDVFERIALRTGELYQTIELTTDGTNPRFSPGGKHIVYERGTGPLRGTRLSATSDPTRVVSEIPGWGGVFSPDGSRFAYLKVTGTPELTAAEAKVESAPAGQERTQATTALNDLVGRLARIVVRDLGTGREAVLDTGTLRKSSLAYAADGAILFSGSADAEMPAQVYRIGAGLEPVALTSGPGNKTPVAVNSNGSTVLVTARATGGRGGRGGDGGGRGAQSLPFIVLSVADGKTRPVDGTAPTFSGDGRSIAYVARDGIEYRLMTAPTDDPGRAEVVRRGPERIDQPTFTPDGSRLAFQMMPREDWELFLVARDGKEERQLTREIQHDVFPQFLAPDRILAVVGEARHRRSYLYDLASGTRTRLFHNNTVRTIAPEYVWSPHPDGIRILIGAERDGDTVSPERGVYLVDLSRRITREQLRARVAANIAAERGLRAKAERIYAPIAADVRAVVAQASVDRVFAYEEALFRFDSKHITRPGNALASQYLFDSYASFGYQPEFQWFEGRNALGGKTANVIATLKGTTNPELVYVVSSHYDSVAAGPGADDDSSGTAALLEAARIMARHPQPATIVFAAFTGEEAGLLGSREFVRRAVADKTRIVGALNNDMIGWANDQRLDNTIRYSNPGIRDVQHAAAMLFTRLITYDALYYKSTDAAAYYEAYGDIVGGIGSYPVLGNPHYHQSHDVLETINHQLVTEVAKTTVATLMLLASSPARLSDLKVERVENGRATLSWTPSPERGVRSYVVAYGPPDQQEASSVRVTAPRVTLDRLAAGTVVSVKAINDKGLEGWDWARIVLK